MSFSQSFYISELNFATKEPFAPLAAWLLSVFGVDSSAAWKTLALYSLLALGVGVYFLARTLFATRSSALLAAGAASLVYLFLFGINPLFLRAYWFPFFLAMLLRVGNTGRIGNFIAFLMSLLLWTVSSGSLAPFGLLAGSFCVALLAIKKSTGRNAEREFYSILSIILLGLAFVLSSVLYAKYPMPDYPWDARLVPVSPLQFRAEPLIASFYQPNSIYYPTYAALGRSIILRASTILGIFVFLASCFFLRARRRQDLHFALSLFFFSCLILSLSLGEWALDTHLSWELLAYYLPFSSVSRMVPGLSHAALPWLLLPFGIIPLLALFYAKMPTDIKLAASLAICILVVFAPNSALSTWARVEEAGTPDQCLAKETTSSRAQCMKRTPSGFLLDRLGSWAASQGERERREFSALKRLLPNQDFQAELSAKPLPEEAAYALDGNSRTRWRTGRAPAEGDYFQLKFKAPIHLLRLVLSVRDLPTDFPRGLRVQVVDASNDEGDLVTVLEQPEWLGAVRWTPNGFPYFGPQSEVVIDLPEEREIALLKTTQISSGSDFDWSIQELKLFSVVR